MGEGGGVRVVLSNSQISWTILCCREWSALFVCKLSLSLEIVCVRERCVWLVVHVTFVFSMFLVPSTYYPASSRYTTPTSPLVFFRFIHITFIIHTHLHRLLSLTDMGRGRVKEDRSGSTETISHATHTHTHT